MSRLGASDSHRCRQRITSSLSCRFSERLKLFTTAEFRFFSPAALSSPSRNGSVAFNGTCFHTPQRHTHPHRAAHTEMHFICVRSACMLGLHKFFMMIRKVDYTSPGSRSRACRESMRSCFLLSSRATASQLLLFGARPFLALSGLLSCLSR